MCPGTGCPWTTLASCWRQKRPWGTTRSGGGSTGRRRNWLACRLPTPEQIRCQYAGVGWLLTAVAAQAVLLSMFARQQQRLLAALVSSSASAACWPSRTRGRRSRTACPPAPPSRPDLRSASSVPAALPRCRRRCHGLVWAAVGGPRSARCHRRHRRAHWPLPAGPLRRPPARLPSPSPPRPAGGIGAGTTRRRRIRYVR
jgi:hypothetical protein